MQVSEKTNQKNQLTKQYVLAHSASISVELIPFIHIDIYWAPAINFTEIDALCSCLFLKSVLKVQLGLYSVWAEAEAV